MDRHKYAWLFVVLMATWAPLQFMVSSEENTQTNDVTMNDDNDVIELVFFAPDDDERLFSRRRIEPAIDYAITKVTESILPNVTIRSNYADSRCNSVNAPLAAFDFLQEKKANVFLGPVCDYSLAPVARYAPHWNVPVISPGGMAHDFGANKQNEYGTLSRVGATFNDVALQIDLIMQTYNWNKLSILYDSYGQSDIVETLCFLLISALGWHLKAKNSFDVRQGRIYPDVEGDLKKSLLENVGTTRSGEYWVVTVLLKTNPIYL